MGRRTFPTNNCVLVSFSGPPPRPSGVDRADVASRMTASMSSFVGGKEGLEVLEFCNDEAPEESWGRLDVKHRDKVKEVVFPGPTARSEPIW